MSTLVVYASKHGSTKQIAEQVTRQLRQAGINDVKCLDTKAAEKQLADARCVVLGAPVYAQKWLTDAAVFAEANREELEGKKLFVFSSGGSEELDPAITAGVAQYNPVEHVYFRGKLAKSSLNLLEKILIYLAKAHYGDARDWTKINAWADQLARKVV